MEPRREVQVFSKNEDGTHVLNMEALERILMDANVKDKPVVVISITGSSRQGKSFLMNFLLRHASGMGDQMGRLQGFTWQGGWDAVTRGIFVWNEVFLVRTPEGREVAVVFMDTQGTFDTASDATDWTIIFALSTIISSVQIYNLLKDIKMNDLDHLLYFAAYAKLAEENQVGKPFQKLLFLIRDWSYLSNASYGYEGGQAFLEHRLPTNGTETQEQHRLREAIWSSFEEVDCFLMPHPGLKAERSPHFQGCVSDIDEDFQEYLLQLVTSIVDPANLVVKRINGKEITCQDLYYHLKGYSEKFRDPNLPPPTSLLEATAEGQHLALAVEAMDLYTSRMQKMIKKNDKMTLEKFKNAHERCRDEALDFFRHTRKMGNDQMSQRHEESVKKGIASRYESLVHLVAGKKSEILTYLLGVATGVGVGACGVAIAAYTIPAATMQQLVVATGGFVINTVRLITH